MRNEWSGILFPRFQQLLVVVGRNLSDSLREPIVSVEDIAEFNEVYITAGLKDSAVGLDGHEPCERELKRRVCGT